MSLIDRIADEMQTESRKEDLLQLNQSIARTQELARRLRAKRDHTADEIAERHSANTPDQAALDDAGSQLTGDRWDDQN